MDPYKEPPKLVFEDEEFQQPSRSFQTPTPTPKIIQLIIKYSGGYIKDEKQANYVLIGFVVLAIIGSLFSFFDASSGSSADQKIIDKTIRSHSDSLRR